MRRTVAAPLLVVAAVATAGSCAHRSHAPRASQRAESPGASTHDKPAQPATQTSADEIHLRIEQLIVTTTPLYRFDVAVTNRSRRTQWIDESLIAPAVCTGELMNGAGSAVVVATPFVPTHPARPMQAVKIAAGESAAITFYLMPGTRLIARDRTITANQTLGDALRYALRWEWDPAPVEFEVGLDGRLRAVQSDQPGPTPLLFIGAGEAPIRFENCAPPQHSGLAN